MNSFPLHQVLAISLGFPALAQQVWKVHCTGAYGAHFTDLPAAVAAASPGDEIWVYDAYPQYPCTPFTAPIITKPLRILGFSVGSVTGVNPVGAALRGVLVIAGTPAGSQVALSNLAIGSTFPAPVGIVAVDCAGDILLEDVGVAGSNIMTGSYMHFERCRNVVFRGCGMSIGACAINAIDSNLLFSFSNIASVYADPSYWLQVVYGTPPPQSFPALRLLRSEATLVSSNLSGSHEYHPTVMPGRPAVTLDDSTLRIGPNSNLFGGWTSAWPNVQVGYQKLTPSVVEQDFRSSITALAWIPMADRPTPRDRISVDHNWATAGLPMSVWVAGPPNGFALLALADWSPFPQPTPFGPLVLDPSSIQILDLLPCALPDGWANRSYNVPITAPLAHAYALQALTLSPAGEFGLSIPSPFTVAWPNGGIP
ncbi:MAG: hypothetical protein WAT39_12030 [Planctomycetota bacterium]